MRAGDREPGHEARIRTMGRAVEDRPHAPAQAGHRPHADDAAGRVQVFQPVAGRSSRPPPRPRGTLARHHETLAPHPGVGVRPMDGVHSRERRREHGARRVGEESSQGGEVREELWTQKSPSRFQPVARGDNRTIVDATQGSQRDRQVR